MKMTGAQALLECLKREHVDVVFGYPGGAVLTLYDELYKAKFPHILTGHEQGAVHAADGYARATGKVGVCFATSGPGVCNMVTGIATANMDSIPLVIISGQVATALIGRDSFQEADISGITTPITKHNYLIKDVKELPRVLKEAFFIAKTGRPGPVLVDIAKDVFDTEFFYTYPEEVQLRGYTGHYEGQVFDLDKAVAALEEARRPLFLTGGGVIAANVSPLLRQIVDVLQVPVITTLMGKGAVDDLYPYHLGMVGMHGSYAANMAVTECDLLVALGARFDDRVTGVVANFAPQAQIIHLDIDKVEINKIIHAHISVNGDLRWSLPLLLKKITASAVPFVNQFATWREHVTQRHIQHPFQTRQVPHTISPQKLFEEVRKRVPDDTIAVTDVGQHQMWTAQFFNLSIPRTFLSSGGLGTMGYGLPAAMGAKIGCPRQMVVLFTGDGSIMMNCQEFMTLTKYGIDIKVIVLHNNVLGMVNQWQRMFYKGHYSASILADNPDITKVSASMGVSGWKVSELEELIPTLEEFLIAEGAGVLNVRIPEDENVYPMVPGGKRLDQMVWEGKTV